MLDFTFISGKSFTMGYIKPITNFKSCCDAGGIVLQNVGTTERLCSDSTTLVENSTLCPTMSRNIASELHTHSVHFSRMPCRLVEK